MPLRVLVVKTTSMGDVVHMLPAVEDLLRSHPDAEIDWLVEAPFAAIPALHPGVRRVIPQAWRKWRKKLFEGATWQALGDVRKALREKPYDLIIDAQGLLKSVMWAVQAHGPRVGFDRHSIREPLASAFYQRKVAVSRSLQAVERNRRLMAGALGQAFCADTPAQFGLAIPQDTAWAMPQERYALMIPCASRVEKRWPEADWVAVGQRLKAAGLGLVILWGSPDEEQLAHRLAEQLGAVVPPFLKVRDMAAVIGRAQMAVGLDTGFSHLAAAYGLPTVGIYCDHEPGLAGLTGPALVQSLGGKGQVPSRAVVLGAVERALSTLV
ncbi:MAG: lipopolysaccharide heptosyltransferase I [Ideonella sp. MAG2]|nr:MAG: lipopolysaccharide heptosyltransferase I [Ideonella sp. MAG2]